MNCSYSQNILNIFNIRKYCEFFLCLLGRLDNWKFQFKN